MIATLLCHCHNPPRCSHCTNGVQKLPAERSQTAPPNGLNQLPGLEEERLDPSTRDHFSPIPLRAKCCLPVSPSGSSFAFNEAEQRSPSVRDIFPAALRRKCGLPERALGSQFPFSSTDRKFPALHDLLYIFKISPWKAIQCYIFEK